MLGSLFKKKNEFKNFKAEHTTLYMINKNVYSKTSKTIMTHRTCTQKECDKELEMGWKAGAKEKKKVLLVQVSF